MRNRTSNDVRQTPAAEATLLDVRTTAECKAGRLPDAKPIPLAGRPLRAHEQIDKEKSVFIDCDAGEGTRIAERVLAGLVL